MPKMLDTRESFKDMGFPVGGVDLSVPFESQRPRPMPDKTYGRTCREGINVRAYEAGQDRRRGGVRAGMVKAFPNPVVDGWIVQNLSLCVGVGYSAPGGRVPQLSQSGRLVSVLAVAKGNVYTALAGDSVWVAAINNTAGNPPLVFDGLVYSAVLNQRIWFADGTNYCYYDQATNTVNTWNATAGTMPQDTDGNSFRLICPWRGRVVVAGFLKDSQNYYGSATDDPTDWNAARSDFSPSQAFVGTTGPLGSAKDVITTLIPYNDDVLVFGLDHSIYLLNGDPLAGGQLDLVSDAIGMAWATAWCKDPFGALYFVSNKCGIYQLQPSRIQGVSAAPQRISQAIEQYLQGVNTGTHVINLAWNDKFQGMHVFISLAAQPSVVDTHLFWEIRTGGWWKDRFANKLHNPLCCLTFDGNLPGDRSTLIGSWDGYVRSFSTPATDDDGTPIESSVVIGPINSPELDDIMFKAVQPVIGEGSGDVKYEVFVGPTAEGALSRPAVASGTWSVGTIGSGRGLSALVRSSGHALYLRVSSTNYWAMEKIRGTFKLSEGGVRKRGA